MGKIDKAQKAITELRKQDNQVEVALQVRDMAHAKSEEVLKYCVDELQKGTTWNKLRRKLGLGHAGVDARWRTIKEILCSAVMPASEEEALQASLAMSNYMMTSIEDLIERIDERTRATEGKKEEAQMLKVQLEAIKFQKEIYDKKFEHYAKLKELKMVDKKGQGQSIIFQNNYFVPRPGQNVQWKDGRPVVEVESPTIEASKGIEIANESSRRRE